MPASVSMTPEKFARWVQTLPQQLVPPSYAGALKQCAVAIKADVRKNFENSRSPEGVPWKPLLHRRPNSKGADKPLLNTGILMASVVGAGKGHVEEITDTTLVVGTADERARVHQEGVPGPTWDGRPRKAKSLAIPLTKEATRVRSPRDFPQPLVLIPRGSKPALLVEKLPAKGRKGERWVTHFLLVPKVEIPARPFLGFSKDLLNEIDNILFDYTEKFWLEGP